MSSLWLGIILLNLTAGLVQSQVVQTNEAWTTQPDLTNKLPATLTPIFESTVQVLGQCFLQCNRLNCSSVAYSERYKSCKLFSHPNIAIPLPALKKDTQFGHTMYYKRYFCPPGWESDPIARMCYYAASTAAVQRPDAWEVCEARFMSRMVTFTSADQRSRLYDILAAKYPAVSKWWTGYAMFDSNLWPRAVEEIPGYIKRRGSCPSGGFIESPCRVASAAECASLCDRRFRDQCTAFTINRKTGQCCLLFRSCDNPGDSDANLAVEIWIYDKEASRVPPTMTPGNCPNYDIQSFSDVSQDQCYKMCRTHPHCVSFHWRQNRLCWLKWKTCQTKTFDCGSTCFHYDLQYTNDGPCPFGVRYRDLCLTKHRTSVAYPNNINKCRQMGGKVVTPIETRKNEYLYIASDGWSNTQFIIDITDIYQEGNWTTFDGSLVYSSNPVYQRWGWYPGEPNGGSSAYCVQRFQLLSSSTGNRANLDDYPGTVHARPALCESPAISGSWPQNCRFTPPGREYHGNVAATASNAFCRMWSTTPYNASGNNWQRFPDWYTEQSFCRNPDSSVISTAPWCYRADNNQPEACNIPMCPESDWAPSQVYDNPTMPYAVITNTASADKYDWTTESVAATAAPLCSMSMTDWCPYYFRGSCYSFYQIQMNYDEAAAACSQNGWHLVAPTSKDENHFLMGTLLKMGKMWYAPAQGYYIGLKGDSTTGRTWITGEPFTQGYWHDGQGSGAGEQCHFFWLAESGYWQDMNCWYKAWFICEVELS